MSEQEQVRNPFLDEYNHNQETEVKFHFARAKKFIQTQYELLIKAGFKPINAGNRLRTDLDEIWSAKTIRNALPIEARHLEKVRRKLGTPYYEPAKVEEVEKERSQVDIDDEDTFEAQMAEAEAHPSTTLPPVTRRCPSCQTVIAIGENYQLSVYQ